MKTIVIANQKGGIGKTTTATNMASILSEKGFNTLLIDADMQGNSTDTYRAKIEKAATLYDVLLDDDRIPLHEAIQSTECGKIIASDPLLRKADEIIKNDIDGAYRLQDAIQEIQDFDYIIIDTAPALNSVLYNCLIAADEVIIPITADRYALQGLSQLLEAITTIKKRQNRKLKIAGMVLVKFNKRTILGKEIQDALQEIADQNDTILYNTTIRESIKVKEAQALRKTLISYAPKSTAAEDYINFVNEYMEGGAYNGKE